MTKVLHLIHSFNRGGIEKWLISMLHQIPRNEWEMDVCCKGADTGFLAELAQQSGAKVLHCPLGLAHVGFARRLQQILIEGQYQLLHNHLEAYSGFPVWLAHRLNIPVVTSFHNTYFLTSQTQLTRLPIVQQLRTVYANIGSRYALRHSDLVTGCSNGVIQSLDPDGTQQLKARSRVLYYGVNIPELATEQERVDFRHSFSWDEDTPVVLHVGRLIEQKNHLGLLSIFQLVLEQIPTAKLLLVGVGPLRELIETTIAERGMAYAVHLLGSRDDVPTLMSRCDVFLFPSIHEGFGLVAIEASAAGLPIVGSRIPGLVEAVRDGETALLHDVNDIQGMAVSVVKLLKDCSYSKQFGQTGRKWIENNFSTESSARNLCNIYSSLVPT